MKVGNKKKGKIAVKQQRRKETDIEKLRARKRKYLRVTESDFEYNLWERNKREGVGRCV